MYEPDEITAITRRLRVIWLALLLIVVIFAGAVRYMLHSGGLSGAPTFSRAGLTYIAVMVALALLSAPLLRRKVEAVPPGATAVQVVQRWQAGWIVGQAVKEAVGMVGLVIGLLARSPAWALGFAIASVGSMLLTPPWEHELRLRLRRITGEAYGPLR